LIKIRTTLFAGYSETLRNYTACADFPNVV